jgi:hypothetical protein
MPLGREKDAEEPTPSALLPPAMVVLDAGLPESVITLPRGEITRTAQLMVSATKRLPFAAAAIPWGL